MDAYSAPGAGASAAIEQYLMNQAKQRDLQVMDEIALAGEKRAAARATQENQWKLEDREKSATESEIAGLQIGDVPTEDLRRRAAKYHIPIPVQTAAPGQQPTYAGSPRQRFGAKVAKGGMTPEQVLGGAIQSLPPSDLGAVERFVQPKAPTLRAAGEMTVSQAQNMTKDPRTLTGAPLDVTDPNAHVRMFKTGPNPEDVAFDLVAPAQQIPVFVESTQTGRMYQRQPNGDLKEVSEIPKGAKPIRLALPPASQFKETERGFMAFQPTRAGAAGETGAIRLGPQAPPQTPRPAAAPVSGAQGAVAPASTPMTPGALAPTAPVSAPAPIPTAATAPKPTAAPSAPRTIFSGGPKPVTVNGQPLYGKDGPPLTEDEVSELGYMAAMGFGKEATAGYGGMGGQRTKNTIIRVAHEFSEGKRVVTPADLDRLQKVVNVELKKPAAQAIRKSATFAEQAYQTFNTNMKVADDAYSKLGNLPQPSLNRIKNVIAKEGWGSASLAGAEASLYTALGEYAKLRSGSFQSVAGITDSASKEAQNLLNSMMSPSAFQEVSKRMKQDAKNVVKGYTDVADRAEQSLVSGGKASKDETDDPYQAYLARTREKK